MSEFVGRPNPLCDFKASPQTPVDPITIENIEDIKNICDQVNYFNQDY
jgi:hypothetical protein